MGKICPSCGDEFQLWATRCPDCDVALGFSAPAPRVEPAETLPPATELALLEQGEPWALRALAERLQEHGISSRIDTVPPRGSLDGPAERSRSGQAGRATRLGLYVRRDDGPAAAELAREHLASRLPDLPDGAAAEDRDPDPSGCPACGEAAPPDAAECPACGLAFPEAG
jgi:hypothetical protein